MDDIKEGMSCTFKQTLKTHKQDLCVFADLCVYVLVFMQ
jgi:hypothetical protein